MARRSSGRSNNLLLFLLLSAASLFSSSSSLRFDLQTGHTKCISEDIKVASMSVGKYSVVNPSSNDDPLPDDHKITVRVSPYKDTDTDATPMFVVSVLPSPNPSPDLNFDWILGDVALWKQLALRGPRGVWELRLYGVGSRRLFGLFLDAGPQAGIHADGGVRVEDGDRRQGLDKRCQEGADRRKNFFFFLDCVVCLFCGQFGSVRTRQHSTLCSFWFVLVSCPICVRHGMSCAWYLFSGS
ncbi:transmembrane emp24 domain-containing protein p24delta9-like [Iris pallida]|uniref:Transmembrane emp24 domain-containing protein p24delta9-like n=1 Tax=Iris pallida TaxID=29817 RepID=A0AAX6H383_IRIPA|nr:transmembrane emp24 domain-containing protein p24delta9-like [Iris pallida]